MWPHFPTYSTLLHYVLGIGHSLLYWTSAEQGITMRGLVDALGDDSVAAYWLIQAGYRISDRQDRTDYANLLLLWSRGEPYIPNDPIVISATLHAIFSPPKSLSAEVYPLRKAILAKARLYSFRYGMRQPKSIQWCGRPVTYTDWQLHRDKIIAYAIHYIDHKWGSEVMKRIRRHAVPPENYVPFDEGEWWPDEEWKKRDNGPYPNDIAILRAQPFLWEERADYKLLGVSNAYTRGRRKSALAHGIKCAAPRKRKNKKKQPATNAARRNTDGAENTPGDSGSCSRGNSPADKNVA